MKKKNTNGPSGGAKGWQVCGTTKQVGVILGYDPSTYEQVLGGLTAKQERAITLELGQMMWDTKEEAISAVEAEGERESYRSRKKWYDEGEPCSVCNDQAA